MPGPLAGEFALPADVRGALSGRGHNLEVPAALWMGGGHVVLHDSNATVNYAASSPRKAGAATPEPPPYFAPKAARSRSR